MVLGVSQNMGYSLGMSIHSKTKKTQKKQNTKKGLEHTMPRRGRRGRRPLVAAVLAAGAVSTLCALHAAAAAAAATSSSRPPVWPCNATHHYPPAAGEFRLLRGAVCALNFTVIVNNDGLPRDAPSPRPARLALRGPADVPRDELPVITTAAAVAAGDPSEPRLAHSPDAWVHRLFRVGSALRQNAGPTKNVYDLPAWATCATGAPCDAAAANASQPSGILLLEHLVLRGGVSRFGGGAVFVALRGRFTGVGVWFDQNRAPVQVPRFSESDDFVQCCVDGPCALAGPGLHNLSAATRDAWNARQAPGGGGGGGECALATRQNQCKNNPVRSLCVWDVAADVCRPAWPGVAVTSGGSGGDYFSRKSNKPCGNGGAVLVKPFSLKENNEYQTVDDATGNTAYPCLSCGFACASCLFTNNSASSDGGAVYAELALGGENFHRSESAVDEFGVAWLDSTTQFPAGLSPVSLVDCTFEHNRAGYSKGEVRRALRYNLRTTNERDVSTPPDVAYVLGADRAACALEGATAFSNRACVSNPNAKTKGRGGALFVHEANVTVSGCVFRQNKALMATNSVTNGGGGAVFASVSRVSVRDTTFEDNLATGGPGGALRPSRSWVAVVDSTFRRNVVAGNSGGGAVVLDDGQRATFTRVLFEGNSCGLGNSWPEACVYHNLTEAARRRFDSGVNSQCDAYNTGPRGELLELLGGRVQDADRECYGGAVRVMGKDDAGLHNTAVLACADCVFRGNRASLGGGLYVGARSKVVLYGSGTRFEKNEAAIAPRVPGVDLAPTADGAAAPADTFFREIEMPDANLGSGAAVYASASTLCVSSGAAMYAPSPTSLDALPRCASEDSSASTATMLLNNSAALSGGGAFLDQVVLVVLGRLSFLANEARRGRGGGVYLVDSVVTQVGAGQREGTLVVQRNSAAAGGGVYAKSFLLVLDPLSWSGNTASAGAGTDIEIDFSYRDIAVVRCPTGSFYDRDAVGRLNASEGFFKDGMSGGVNDSAVCRQCPAGWHSPNPFSFTCFACVEGRYGAAPPAVAAAVTTDPTSHPSSLPCETCPEGFANGLVGQAACNMCAAGYFSSKAGAPFCTECPRGKFAAEESDACQSCPRGWFAEGFSSPSCEPCPRGRFAAQSEQTKCEAPKCSTRGAEVLAVTSSRLVLDAASDPARTEDAGGWQLNISWTWDFDSLEGDDSEIRPRSESAQWVIEASAESSTLVDRCLAPQQPEGNVFYPPTSTTSNVSWTTLTLARDDDGGGGNGGNGGTGGTGGLSSKSWPSSGSRWSIATSTHDPRKRAVHFRVSLMDTDAESLGHGVVSEMTSLWAVAASCLVRREYLQDSSSSARLNSTLLSQPSSWVCETCPVGADCVDCDPSVAVSDAPLSESSSSASLAARTGQVSHRRTTSTATITVPVAWSGVRARDGWQRDFVNASLFHPCFNPEACVTRRECQSEPSNEASSGGAAARTANASQKPACPLNQYRWASQCNEELGYQRLCAGDHRSDETRPCRLCATCVPGFARDATYECAACPEGGGGGFLALGVVVAAAVMCTMVGIQLSSGDARNDCVSDAVQKIIVSVV